MIAKSRRLLGSVFLFLLVISLSSCQFKTKEQVPDEADFFTPSPSSSRHLANYGDANLAKLTQKLHQANQKSVKIVQIGDSHTAADIFSGQLRERFQNKFGDGGIGLITPLGIPGVRSDLVKIKQSDREWELTSSRTKQSNIFPMGGYLATPLINGASVRINSAQDRSGPYQLSLLYYSNASSNILINSQNKGSKTVALEPTRRAWAFSPAVKNVYLPAEISVAKKQGFELGGFYLTSPRDSGVIYSALGVNGGRLSIWDKWHPSWLANLKALDPDLVVLAYGTNEAFNDTLNAKEFSDELGDRIKLLRHYVPDAVILIVGAPDSIKRDRGGSTCKARQPENLSQVVSLQKRVAQQQKTLYWDWQQFMGGKCAILQWHQKALANDDLVHLTREGYKKSANGLYQDLITVFGFTSQ